jgi:polysaccharide biosynthesis transport protein
MTPRQVLAVLMARLPWAVAVLLLCIAASAAVSLTMLKRYTASASVMLDARTPEQVAGGALNSGLPYGYLATQVDLIMSERVGRAVIAALGLSQNAEWRQAWLKAGGGQGDFEAWLSEALVKGLTVGPSPVSNVVNIAYTADDPHYAALVANAYVKAYVETSLELRADRVRQSSGFFDARAQELRTELERTQKALSDYQQRNGLLVGDDKLNIESIRLAELSTQLTVAQSASAEMSGRLRQAGRQTDQLGEVMRSPSVAALSAEVTREEVRLREMTARLGDSHPQLIEQQARLLELQSKLAVEKGRAVTSVNFDTSATQSRVGQISAALEAQRAKVLKMQIQREQSVALQRDAENAQRAYEQMQQRVNLASVESQNTHTTVTVLKQAAAPLAPSSPNLLKNIGASIAAGLLLGVGLVLGMEQLDRRLRTTDDLTELKQPLLVSLPVSAHAHRQPGETSRTQLMKQRVLTGLPRPASPQAT